MRVLGDRLQLDRGALRRVVTAVDGHVQLGQRAQRQQFRCRERPVLGAAAPEHHHLLDRAAAQYIQSMLRDVAGHEPLGIACQDPRYIQRDIAVADHHGATPRQIERTVGVVRMPVVPGHEFTCGKAARQVFPRDTELPVVGSAACVDHRMVVVEQFVDAEVTSDLHTEKCAEAVAAGGTGEDPLDGLRRLMIRCHTEADEPTDDGESLEHGDLHVDVTPFQQFLGSVEGGRTGTHDRHPQRTGPLGDDDGLLRHLRRAGHGRVPQEVCGIEILVDLGLGCEIAVGRDRLHRTHVGARPAIDAGVRIDVEHLGARVLRFVGSRVNAVHRTHRDTRRVVAAGLGDYVCHGYSG
ncbi:hypothetical protein AIIKEEIJ_02604 [Rhodococcus sp. YH1]|nr:hypothetical protein [Rhodococcus sp. YH1]